MCTSREQLAKPDLILPSYPTICWFGDDNKKFETNKTVQYRTPASQPPCCGLGWACLYLTSQQSFIPFYYEVDYPHKLSFLHLWEQGQDIHLGPLSTIGDRQDSLVPVTGGWLPCTRAARTWWGFLLLLLLLFLFFILLLLL